MRAIILLAAIVISTLSFELSDPRFRDSSNHAAADSLITDHDAANTQASKPTSNIVKSWSVIDMHWLTLQVDRPANPDNAYYTEVYTEGETLVVYPNVGYSSVNYNVVKDNCGASGGTVNNAVNNADSSDVGQCVEIPYAVDRQSKVVLLSVPDIFESTTSGTNTYLKRMTAQLCSIENLSSNNCKHFGARLEDAVDQQVNGIQGRMRVEVVNRGTMREVKEFDFPFPEEIVLEGENVQLRGRSPARANALIL